MTLRELAKEIQDYVADGICNLVIWKTGKQWHYTDMWDYDGEDEDEKQKFKDAEAIDPYAIVLNSYNDYASSNLAYIERHTKCRYEHNKEILENGGYLSEKEAELVQIQKAIDWYKANTPDDLKVIAELESEYSHLSEKVVAIDESFAVEVEAEQGLSEVEPVIIKMTNSKAHDVLQHLFEEHGWKNDIAQGIQAVITKNTALNSTCKHAVITQLDRLGYEIPFQRNIMKNNEEYQAAIAQKEAFELVLELSKQTETSKIEKSEPKPAMAAPRYADMTGAYNMTKAELQERLTFENQRLLELLEHSGGIEHSPVFTTKRRIKEYERLIQEVV